MRHCWPGLAAALEAVSMSKFAPEPQISIEVENCVGDFLLGFGFSSSSSSWWMICRNSLLDLMITGMTSSFSYFYLDL